MFSILSARLSLGSNCQGLVGSPVQRIAAASASTTALLLVSMGSANAQTLYVSEIGGGVVDKVSTAGVITPFVSSINAPEGLAFDCAGNLYVASFSSDSVSKVTAGAQSVRLPPALTMLLGLPSIWQATSMPGVAALSTK